MSRVILAYSGGLHTSVSIHWLRREKNMRVIAVTLDLGQQLDLREQADRAISAGADSVHILDMKQAFVTDYIFKALKANARTQSGYLLTTALARPLISRELVKIAREENCKYVAHGARGNRNDISRYESCISTLAPDIQIIAPLAEWKMKTRHEEIAYAKQHKIPIHPRSDTSFGVDRNIWGTTIRCNVLTDTWAEPPADVPYLMTIDPAQSPDEPAFVEIGFERGLPVSLDGEPIKPLQCIERLNKIAGEHGVGRLDTVEETLAGQRTRSIYEAPGATVLYAAHEALELLVQRRLLVRYKEQLGRKYADLIFRGQWFDEFRECLDEFFDRAQQRVTGSVKMKLFKGSCAAVGRKSKFSLFETEIDDLGL